MLDTLASVGSKILGGILSDNAAEKNAERNIALQREFAQSGIQWKVADATKAGIHPLAALGASTTSFAPVSVGGSALGSAVASSGQDISRALAAGSTDGQKATAFTQAAQALTLEKGALENEVLRSQLARLKGLTPFPNSAGNLMDGQGNTPPNSSVKIKPMEVTATGHGPNHLEPSSVPSIGYGRTASGGFEPIPSKDVQERIEDNMFAQFFWMMKNQILPSMGANESPPPYAPPPGFDEWRYHPFYHEYRPARKFGKSRPAAGTSGGW